MKILFVIIGCLALALGTIGIFIPLLPTTPFLLLSAALFVRSSPRLYNWLITRPLLGKYIINYRERRAMPLRGKILSIGLMWVSILVCVIFIVDHLLWLQILLLVKSAVVTWYILSLNSSDPEQ